MLAGQLPRLRPGLVLPQDPDDLCFRKSRASSVRPLEGPDSSAAWTKFSGAGHRLRAVERLDCSFVVDREHDDVSGRIDVGARQYRAAGRRIAGRLDAVAGCGAPDALDRGDADPGASAIIPTVQSATSPGEGSPREGPVSFSVPPPEQTSAPWPTRPQGDVPRLSREIPRIQATTRALRCCLEGVDRAHRLGEQCHVD